MFIYISSFHKKKMKFTSFIFICGLYLALIFFGNVDWLGMEVQFLIAVTSILFVGIPHGAIDHIIFFEENKSVSVFQFYLFYLSLMAGYALVWIFFPSWSFAFFLLLSAFHFGQSQFSDIKCLPKRSGWGLYFTWGCSILSGLVLYSLDEIPTIFAQHADAQPLILIFNEKIHSIIFPVSTLLFLLHFSFLCWSEKIPASRFFMEIFLFALIHISFFLLPIMIGFSLYFCTLHSTRVLTEEFNYLKIKRKDFDLWQFIQLLFPYTLLSVFGGALLFVASYWNLFSISNVLLAFILISILTLPHSFVMDEFYKKSEKRNLSEG